MRRYLPFLDGWRGGAIALLLAGHFTAISAFTFGRLAVELFFVLSGRLMAQILFVERMQLPTFFVRRIARIVPLLLIATVAIRIAAGFMPALGVSNMDVLGVLTLTLNYMRASANDPTGSLAHLWSICIEEHAYLFLAGLAFLARRRTIPVALVLAVVCLACMANGAVQTIVFDRTYYEVYWRTDVRGASILAGTALFLALRDVKSLPAWLPVAALLVGMSTQIATVPDYVKYSLGTILLAASIATVDRSPSLRPFLSSRALGVIGVLAYSLYVWQQPFFIAPYPKAVMLAGAIIVAVLSYKLLEAPARRLINQSGDALLLRREVAGFSRSDP